MPLRLTSAPISGIKKKKTATPHPRASPFAAYARSKPITRERSKLEVSHREEAPLPDLGLSQHISETAPVEDVIQAVRYVKDTMFEVIPARSGMNSIRIAHVLNLRRSLPPLASVAHVHALLQEPTRVEKEIIDLVRSGSLRRLIIPDRVGGLAGIGDCLVLAEDLEGLVRENVALDQALKERFCQVLNQLGSSLGVPLGFFTSEEAMALVHAGFLVSGSPLAKGPSSAITLPTIPPSLAARAFTRNEGTDQPVSKMDAVRDLSPSQPVAMFLSLPNTGPYLRLLGLGRSHLLGRLKKSCHREVPLSLLHDRWDGAVETNKSFSVAKRARGEVAGVSPGRTKKWKELYGMSFRWALEEALGAGLIELFDTGSVGPGVRCV